MPQGFPVEWPDFLPGYQHRPDQHHSYQARMPQGIVVHSGDKGRDLVTASLRMDISYHFAWNGKDRFIQLVSMSRRAWHAGGVGNHWLGIALSGPWNQDPRQEDERLKFRMLVESIVESFAGHIRYWCRHSDIEPGKKDPGPGFTGEWIDGLGLEWRKASG